jgi:hypothetical protein
MGAGSFRDEARRSFPNTELRSEKEDILIPGGAHPQVRLKNLADTWVRPSGKSQIMLKGKRGTRPSPSQAQTLKFNHQHRAGGLGNHPFGDAPHEQPLQPGAAVGTQDDQVDVLGAGNLEDDLRG